MTNNLNHIEACQEIKFLIEVYLKGSECFVSDVSQSHAHHQSKRGLSEEGIPTHIQITIKTDLTIKKSRVERDREIYTLLDPFFQKGLHSAEIKFISFS